MEKNILKRQYKFFVTICIVVGFVVGTGIFWRPGRVLYESNGELWTGVLAWVVGGIMVATCVYMFSVLAARYEKIHGMVDYAEAIVGKRYGYLAGWFFAIMYQTAGYALIAYITATATATFAGHENVHDTAFVFFLTAFYMAVTFAVNYLAPKLPMRFNVATTCIRIVPIILMGTLGIILAANTGDNVYSVVRPTVGEGIAEPSFFGAIFATVFAYNGWQAAVAFNSEVKNSKRNFPIALLVGFVFVIIIYVLYFIGVVTAADPTALMANNQLGTRAAFASVFGYHAGRYVMIFVIISGLGILNMCCMGMSRGLYSLARRGVGPMPDRMVQLDSKTGVPVCSMVTCVGVSFLWLMVIYGNRNGWFGTLGGRRFMFDLADFYNMIFFVLLIPIFIGFVLRHRRDATVHWFNRFVAPVLAVGAAGFMIFALITASWQHAAIYFAAFVVLAGVGALFLLGKKGQKPQPLRKDISSKLKPELLAPAGDFEKLQAAIAYGADAVYLGGKQFSLRANTKNFDDAELVRAIEYAHANNVRVYVTVNIFAHNTDMANMEQYLQYLRDIGADAVIVADPGVLDIARQVQGLEIHISTQANVTNLYSAALYKSLGASRVILARELSHTDIRKINDHVADETFHTEVFAHGAMCVSYSGRCLLSSYMTGRDANHGDCSQPCRWKYHLMEEERPGEYLPVFEDEHGTYVMNSKDLCLIGHIPELVASGVSSLKIEGRMKSAYYVAVTTRIYREALDDYFTSEELYRNKIDYYIAELQKTSHRDYFTGFFLEPNGTGGQIYTRNTYTTTHEYLALVVGYDEQTGSAIVEQRNKFAVGDEVEFLKTSGMPFVQIVTEIRNEKGQVVEAAPHAKERLWIKVESPVVPFDIMRGERGN